MKVGKVMGYFLYGMILAAGMLFLVGINALAQPPAPGPPGPQEVTITTYYPAPYGVYNELEARESLTVGKEGTTSEPVTSTTTLYGDVAILPQNQDGSAGVEGGNVGIGTTSPRTPAPNAQPGNLDVNDVYVRSSSQWVSQMLAVGSGEKTNSTWSNVQGDQHKNCVTVTAGDLGLASFPPNYNVLVSASAVPAVSGDSGDEASGITVGQKTNTDFKICMFASSDYYGKRACSHDGIETNTVTFTYTVISY